ncbi:MAG: methyltransferase domain-containing protein [Magnetococcales bacterium]|nr:methyltransferase domain-containing protein [Magnetococcales bacterium]
MTNTIKKRLAAAFYKTVFNSFERSQFGLLLAYDHYEKFVIANLNNSGKLIVQGGLFAGLRLYGGIDSGNFNLKHILGSYEAWLNDDIRALAENRARLLNIGCASGYFSNGLAQLNPNMAVVGYDIDNGEINVANQIKELNNLQNVTHKLVSKEFIYDDILQSGDMLIVDIEGGELSLLDPQNNPATLLCDIIVEIHMVGDLGCDEVANIICDRYVKTHTIKTLYEEQKTGIIDKLDSEFGYINRFGQVVAQAHLRGYTQQWLVMKRKNGG